MKTSLVRRCQRSMLLLPLMALLFASPVTARAQPFAAPPDLPAQQTTIVLDIESSSDDVDQSPGGVMLSNPTLMLGDEGWFAASHVGFRFTNATIPQGATIEQASLMLTSAADSLGSMTVDIRGHAVDDSPTFSMTDGPLNRQDQVTVAHASWVLSPWSEGALIPSPDLSSIIQEIVSTDGWISGNALSLLLYDDGVLNAAYRQIVAMDSGIGSAAQLTITYSVSPVDAELIDPNLYAHGEFQPLGYPDLVVTSVETDQAGYPLNDTYTIMLEIMNQGGADSGPFEVAGQIGRYRDGEASLTWGLGGAPLPGYEIGVDVIPGETFVIDSVANLGPGETISVISSERSLAADVFTDSWFLSDVPPWAADTLLPPLGQVFLKATASSPETEFVMENNASVTWFIYPNSPEQWADSYDPNQDADGDGFYPPEDCDDSNHLIHPEQEEIPNDGIDNDCQGGDYFTCHVRGWDICDSWTPPDMDLDADGWTPRDGDCNPFNPNIHPGAVESHNGLDDDCDALVDEGFEFPDPAAGECEDLDGDGWGCGAQGSDCEPFLGAINPGANEIPDGVDNDCDGYIDEGYVTPDWTISSFTLDRMDENCIYHPNQNIGSDPLPLCGIQAEYEVENLGEGLGPSEVAYIRNQVRLLDLAGREFPTFAPYSAFPSQTYAEYMACADAGLIASIPGGLLGEENVSNNLAIHYLDPNERDLDIVHQTVSIGYTRSLSPAHPALDHLRIRRLGELEGSCPPETFFWNYSIQVKIFVEGEQVFMGDFVEQQIMPFRLLPIGQDGLYFKFPQRPGNNDAIRIEILLNGDERFDEDLSNNLCVINLTYDRNAPPIWAHFDSDLSVRMNDELILESSQGCDAEISMGAVGEALTGTPAIQLTFVIGMVVMLGAGLGGGGLLAGQIARRVGMAGAGRILTSIVGALVGGAVLVAASIGIASIGGRPYAELSGPQRLLEPSADSVAGLILETDAPQVVHCDELVTGSMEAITDAEGAVEDLQIHLQPSEGASDYFYRVTLWNGEGNPAAVLTTEDTTLSLASEGLFPELGTPIYWQVEVVTQDETEEDDYLPSCIPMIRAFPGGETLEGIEIEVPDEPVQIVTPTPPPDTAAPVVSGMSAVPNPTLTTVPVTISATITDSSGVASSALYYKVGKGAVQYGGEMLHYGGNQYSLQIGPLVPAGTYTYYIVATDTLGNATCTLGTIGACPSGSFVVNIP